MPRGDRGGGLWRVFQSVARGRIVLVRRSWRGCWAGLSVLSVFACLAVRCLSVPIQSEVEPF